MKNTLLQLIFILISAASFGQAVSWELSAEPGNQVSNIANNQSNNFSNCTLSRGSGITATTGTGSMNASGWYSGTTATTLADAIAANDYYEFTCNTINCLFFNPTSIKIVLRSSATGPNTATLRCSSDGFSTDLGTVTVGTTSTAFTFPETTSPNSQTVTYRLYGYGGAAGGGAPSSGGTMRIGSSVVAGDNDLEIFSSTTLLAVNQVANISVNNGAGVPATALTANVPGASINWSRTPETIGLAPTSGTGDVPAFTATNNTSAPITSTFIVTAALGNCTSVIMTFTITVIPPACNILSVNFLGNPSSCNDNGTPNDPSDDFFTQNIQSSFINRPSTGSLQIVPGGDQIGTYSIPVSQIIGNSHIFNGVQLKADGTPSVIQINFTDNTGCINTGTGPTVQPCSGSSVCEVIGFSFANINFCNNNGTPNDPSDDFFTVDVDMLYSNSVAGRQLRLSGTDVVNIVTANASVGTNLTRTFTGVKLRASGQITNFTGQIGILSPGFVENCASPGTGPAVGSCSSAPPTCSVNSITLQNIGSCNDNGTSDPGDDFFTANVLVTFTNPPATGNLEIEPGGDAIGINAVPVSNLVGTSHTFTGVKFKADGTTTVIEVDFTADNGCVRTATAAAVPPCSVPCSVNSITLQSIGSCNDNGTSDPSDDFFTANVLVTFTSPPATGSLEIEPGGDAIGINAVPVSSLVGNSHTFTGVKFKADGTSTVIEVDFTADNGCVRTATAAAVPPCSIAPPVLVCPLNVTVSCADQAPPVNTASVQVTHDCPGNVTVTQLGDVNSNVTCINRMTITRTYRGVDQCGHSATCSQTIVLNDQTPPTVTCQPPVTVSCASQVPAVDVFSLGVTDNCSGGIGISRSFVSESTSNQTCANRFTITRIYKGGDACGNTATCTQVITVNDQTPPGLTCPAGQTVTCASQVPAQNTALVTGLSDNCGGATPTVSFVNDLVSNQTCANRFTLTRTYRALDQCGNSATCTQIITVNDQVGPTLTCPAAQTISCSDQTPAPNPALVTNLGDNCGGTATPSFFSDVVSNQTCINRFTLTRQYRAVDACGNTGSCTQVITVNDQTPPAFTSVPANTTVDCYLVPGIGIATASDNCTSGATVTFQGEVRTQGICPVFYILTRTWRATDACGNNATASQVVTVTDTHAPQFLAAPKNAVVECGPNNASEYQAFLDNFGGAMAEDCAQITYSHEDSPIQSNAYNCGNTFRKNVRFTATDECGNASYRDASFTVVDQTPPVFTTPPQNVALECDATGDNGESAFYDWLDSNGALVAEDACGDVTLEKVLISETHGCGNTWSKTYEFRAKDQCDNLAKTKATFAVVDNTPPTLACAPNDNIYLPCLDDVPAADPSALNAWDCSGVTVTLKDTWTDGTGCPNWPMTVAYRYAAVDGCGNESVCERAFYVKESSTPTLICPDTIKLICVDDIPGPLQLFKYIKNLLAGNCAGGFTSINILTDSGKPQNGARYRTYGITAKNHCGLVTSACSVTFLATGNCNQLCTGSQTSWGDPNGTVGGMDAADVMAQLIQLHGPVTAGGGNHLVSAPTVDCVQELLPGSGTCSFLPTGHFTCPLPAEIANPDGTLNDQIAANVMALQLNIWYNLAFNDRDLGVQDLQSLPPCVIEFPLVKQLGQHSTIQDLLNLANEYLQSYSYYPPDFAGFLNASLENLNNYRADCVPNSPCERPGSRSKEVSGQAVVTHLSPNPTAGNARLEYWSENEGELQLKISDARGVQSASNVQVHKGLNKIEVSLKSFPSGVYWISLQQGTALETLRLIKTDD